MTDLKMDYQLLDEVRVRLEALAAEFQQIQATRDDYDAAVRWQEATGRR